MKHSHVSLCNVVMGLTQVLFFQHTSDRLLRANVKTRFVLETDSLLKTEYRKDFSKIATRVDINKVKTLDETGRKVQYSPYEIHDRGLSLEEDPSTAPFRKYIVKMVGFGDKIKWESEKNLNEIRDVIIGTIRDLYWEPSEISLVIDGDWLKRKSMTFMATCLLSALPELELHIVRTCSTSHLNYMHCTQEYNPTDDINDIIIGPKETWMDLIDKGASIKIWHIIPPTNAVSGPSGMRNFSMSDLVIALGAGAETAKEFEVWGQSGMSEPLPS